MISLRKRPRPRTLAFVVLSTMFSLRACGVCTGPEWGSGWNVFEPRTPPPSTAARRNPTTPGVRYFDDAPSASGSGKLGQESLSRTGGLGRVGNPGRVGDIGRVGGEAPKPSNGLFGDTFAPGSSPLSRLPKADDEMWRAPAGNERTRPRSLPPEPAPETSGASILANAGVDEYEVDGEQQCQPGFYWVMKTTEYGNISVCRSLRAPALSEEYRLQQKAVTKPNGSIEVQPATDGTKPSGP